MGFSWGPESPALPPCSVLTMTFPEEFQQTCGRSQPLIVIFCKSLFLLNIFGCTGSVGLSVLFAAVSRATGGGALASHCGGCSGCTGLSSCHMGLSSGFTAQLTHGMWELSRPGIKPSPPTLAGEFLSLAPPKSCIIMIIYGISPSPV